MLNNFIVSLNAVLPMFLLIGIGVSIKKSGMMGELEIKHLNKMVFIVFFPFMMFENIYGSDISAAINVRLISFGVSAVLIIYVVTLIFVMRIEKNSKSRGAMIQAIYRSNFVIMGIPIAINMFGKGNLAVTAVMVAIIVPLYNFLAVLTLEVFRGQKPKLCNIIKQVIKNPLIIGAFAGILSMVADIKLPVILETFSEDMAAVATPIALVILGASISLRSMRKCGRNVIICIMGRLVVVPAFGLTAAALLGFRNIEFITLLAMFAAPTSVSSFTMAQQMGSDGKLAGNAVIFSSALACFTMFLWIFLFKQLGMF